MLTELHVAIGERPKRLDCYLAGHLRALSRSRLQWLIKQGRVRVNGRPEKSSRLVHGGDVIQFDQPPLSPKEADPAVPAISILAEDDHLLVVNKPSGMVMHPGPGHWQDTVMNALLRHYIGQAVPSDHIKFIHRLDRETSGVLLVAKTPEAQRHLSRQFAEQRVDRQYLALVHGCPAEEAGVIQMGIGRDRRDRTRISADTDEPQHAITKFELVRRYGAIASRLRLRPQTGRTHQLRVHLHALGHPIWGDPLYHGPSPPSDWRMDETRLQMDATRMMLHAEALGFIHPGNARYWQVTSPIPDAISRFETAVNEWEFHRISH